MKRFSARRPLAVDSSHMMLLHKEAIEQLELMRSACEACEHATDMVRDNLKIISENHWEAYLEVIHMICIHDDSMSSALKKRGLKFRDSESGLKPTERLWGNQVLLTLLLLGLVRRHDRFVHFYGIRINPMSEYLKESITMEREHLADIVSMVNYLI
ncbi:hypothetical protein LJC10_04050 [Selenomonadales bacterium OttesenSCG-928-I06]|nr:hypothetical protein [Selenomonadales bacterium OttesenSCG-928-I06]